MAVFAPGVFNEVFDPDIDPFAKLTKEEMAVHAVTAKLLGQVRGFYIKLPNSNKTLADILPVKAHRKSPSEWEFTGNAIFSWRGTEILLYRDGLLLLTENLQHPLTLSPGQNITFLVYLE
jgi:hypothetical protein